MNKLRTIPMVAFSILIFSSSAIGSQSGAEDPEKDGQLRFQSISSVHTYKLRFCKREQVDRCASYDIDQIGETFLEGETSYAIAGLMRGEGKALVRIALFRFTYDRVEYVCWKVKQKGADDDFKRCALQSANGATDYYYPTLALEFDSLSNGEAQLSDVRLVNYTSLTVPETGDPKRFLVLAFNENPYCYMSCRTGVCEKRCRN